MLSLHRPEDYFSPGPFEAEQDAIFRNLWIFAGLAHLVSADNAYVASVIGGKPVVVQNFKGELRAFANVCAHRRKIIQPGRYGTRPLVCGYHGWRYDPNGSVATIPFEEMYAFKKDERDRLGLTPYALTRVGNLLFVNLSAAPIALEEQFSPQLLEQLRTVSMAFDDEVLVASWTGRYNWKLAYENLRDGLHPRFVHTRTLNREVQFDVGVAPAESRTKPGARTSLEDLSYGGAEGHFVKSRHHGFQANVERWGDQDAYFNWLLYPNTHIVSPDGGYLFCVEQHVPISATVTELTAHFMTAKKRRPYASSASVVWDYAKGAKVILDEDTAVMEEAQAGMSSADTCGVQGDYEYLNAMVDQWYAQRLGSRRESS